MSMTVSELRTFVRDQLDADSTELPDSLLDIWLQEGSTRIQQSSSRWSFYESEFSFDTVPGDQTIALTDFTVQVGASSTYLADVLAVEGPQWTLDTVGHETARERFAATSYSGRPRWWSLWAGQVFLWPVPSSVESFLIRGYRSPLTASLPSDKPDLPGEFHLLVGQWMVARAYMQMDDPQMGNQFMASFEGQLGLLRERYESPQRAGGSVMGGKNRQSAFATGRLLYPFE